MKLLKSITIYLLRIILGFFIQNKINTTKKSKYILAGSDKEKIHLLSYNPKKKFFFDKYCKIEKLRKIKIKKFYEKK